MKKNRASSVPVQNEGIRGEAELYRQIMKLPDSRKPRKSVDVPSFDQVVAERERLRRGVPEEKPSELVIEEPPHKKHHSGKELVQPTTDEVLAERNRLQYKSKFMGAFGSTIGILVVVAAVAVLIATLFFPVLQVSGTSMEPVFNDGDIVVLLKAEDFSSGDLVGLYYNGKILLKRVIGLAGDYVNIDADGNVFVNGDYLDEPYVSGKSLGDCDVSFPLQVPADACFVLGDHRNISTDSRNSTIGCVPTNQIIGKTVMRIWPVKEITMF